MEDSSSSIDLSLHVADAVEFTLTDTLDMLKELKLEKDEELERVYNELTNNKRFKPLKPSVNIEDKKQQLILSLDKQLTEDQLTSDESHEYPIANTVDMFTNVVSQLTDEVENIQQNIEIATENLKRKEDDIRSLQTTSRFEKMKDLCLTANKLIASKTYLEELRVAEDMFKEVKFEMQAVVAEIFPNDNHVRDFLTTLSIAYFKSGQDVYIPLEPEVTDAANFLLEAGLIVYHPYDKNIVRLVDLYSIFYYF